MDETPSKGAGERQGMSCAAAQAPFHVLCKPSGPECNLGCVYCFYLPKAKLYPTTHRFRMSPETLEVFIRDYLGQQPATAPEINFAWQGGEPTLMGLDFFRRALALQKKYVRPHQQITNSLQTNGVLIDAQWAQFLHEHDFLVGISIDGPQPLHDTYRKSRGGRGTHAQVMRGLAHLQRLEVRVNVLTVVNDLNVREPARIYNFLKSAGVEYMQFIPLVEHLGAGRVSARSVPPQMFGAFLSRVFDLWRRRDIGRIFVQYFDMLVALAMGLPPSLCVHARTCGRNVALEHNGDLYACDHFVFPETKRGSIHDMSLVAMIDGPAQRRFGLDKEVTRSRLCQDCAWHDLCQGGCPAHRIIDLGDGEASHNYLCQGYRMFFAHAMPYARSMAACLERRMPARLYERFVEPSATSRRKRLKLRP